MTTQENSFLSAVDINCPDEMVKFHRNGKATTTLKVGEAIRKGGI